MLTPYIVIIVAVVVSLSVCLRVVFKAHRANRYWQAKVNITKLATEYDKLLLSGELKYGEPQHDCARALSALQFYSYDADWKHVWQSVKRVWKFSGQKQQITTVNWNSLTVGEKKAFCLMEKMLATATWAAYWRSPARFTVYLILSVAIKTVRLWEKPGHRLVASVTAMMDEKFLPLLTTVRRDHKAC